MDQCFEAYDENKINYKNESDSDSDFEDGNKESNEDGNQEYPEPKFKNEPIFYRNGEFESGKNISFYSTNLKKVNQEKMNGSRKQAPYHFYTSKLVYEVLKNLMNSDRYNCETSLILSNIQLKLCNVLKEIEDFDIEVNFEVLFDKIVNLNYKMEKENKLFIENLKLIDSIPKSNLVIDSRLNINIDENLLSYVLICKFLDCAVKNFESYLYPVNYKKLDWSNLSVDSQKFNLFQELLKKTMNRQEFHFILREIGCENLYLFDDNDLKKLEVRFNKNLDCNEKFQKKFLLFLSDICEIKL
jgi:hypothetical protein